MAEILDARVKQKTGVAADFAGFTLLEGEIALVRTSASGPVWNFKVGPGNFDSLDWSLKNPGAAQKADTSTVFPAGVPGLYIPTESGTYNGVVVDVSAGYVQLIWDGGTLTKAEFPIDLTSYATKDYAVGRDQLIKVKGFDTNINLFDKENDAIFGKQLAPDGGADQTTTQGSVTDFIYIGEKGRVFIRRAADSQSRISWYTSNTIGSFISSHAGAIPASPGGEVLGRPVGARYIRANIAGTPAAYPTAINELMIMVSESLLPYAPYTVFPDISSQIDLHTREDSYYRAVNGVNADSVMNKFTAVDSNFVGRWQIRTGNGTSASKNTDSVTLTNDGTSTNAGLIWPDFFNAAEVGMRIWIEFEAKLLSGDSLWAIYSNKLITSAKQVSISSSGWNKYLIEDEVGSQYADRRLLFAQPAAAASEVEIRDFRIYFTNPISGDQASNIVNDVNLAAIPNFRYKKSNILNGGTDLITFGLQGDSWTDHVPGAIFYARDLSRLLRAEYGNGGGGFYDFSQGSGTSSGQKMASVDPLDADDTRIGSITYKDQTPDAKGVNFAHAEFASGSELTLNVLTPHTGLVIHYYGGAGYGSFRYRVDGGSWTTVNTASDEGYNTIPLSVPDDAHTIDFETISGTCIILGVDMQRSSGIRVHKLGNRGLRTYQIRTVDGANWENAIASLSLDSMSILLGTNDRTDDRTPTQFKSDLEYFIGLYKNANQYGDIMLISPSNNRNVETYAMQEYASMMADIATSVGYAFTSLIPLFGDSDKIIDKGTFFDSVHPTETGGQMIAQHLFTKVL